MHRPRISTSLKRFVTPTARASSSATLPLSSTSSASSRYGRYDVLSSASCLTAYPPPRPVPASIPRPAYVPANFFTAPIWEHDQPNLDMAALMSSRAAPLGNEGIEGARKAGKLAANVLKQVGQLVQPGVTTDDLDKAAHELIVAAGAYPSPLGYSAFPRSITTSVNNIIAHGIPDDRPLQEGDIVNLDVTVFLNGYHGDTSATFMLPRVDDAGHELVERTQEALARALEASGPGVPYTTIGDIIHDFADRVGLVINTQFSGHGIGRNFHQFPYILHHRNREEGVMEIGDCFTIEPPLVQGTNPRGTLWDDGWTVATESGARSAQFEHQVLITDDGAEVLTVAE